VDLAQDYGPGGWFVTAAAGGFVKTERLEGSGEGEEEQGGSDEHAEIKMDQAEVLQKSVRRGHYLLFTHRNEIRQVQSDIPVYGFCFMQGLYADAGFSSRRSERVIVKPRMITITTSERMGPTSNQWAESILSAAKARTPARP